MNLASSTLVLQMADSEGQVSLEHEWFCIFVFVLMVLNQHLAGIMNLFWIPYTAFSF
jgi:hypothetical protein